MLIDRATIFVKSGKGGDGHVSFRREKYISKGGPDGGDGGDGGSVYLVAADDVDTLLDLSGRHHWNAKDGQDGGRKQCTGKRGADLIIKVPPGTLIYDALTDELIEDLNEIGQRLLVAKGGEGGFGNEHFKTAIKQTPRESTPGEKAEERTLRLELKLIADIGLLGKPNAGKSTLISRVSKATPKIADYPFTTLEPNLGIAELPGYRRMVIADIPGLIEGAHEGQGLGMQFLRHVERTRVLVHLIEIEPLDETDPVENYRAIRRELSLYSDELANKPEVIVVSKMDLLASDEDRETAAKLIEEELGIRPLQISSVTGTGMTEVLEACWQLLDKNVHTKWSAETEGEK